MNSYYFNNSSFAYFVVELVDGWMNEFLGCDSLTAGVELVDLMMLFWSHMAPVVPFPSLLQIGPFAPH